MSANPDTGHIISEAVSPTAKSLTEERLFCFFFFLMLPLYISGTCLFSRRHLASWDVWVRLKTNWFTHTDKREPLLMPILFCLLSLYRAYTPKKTEKVKYAKELLRAVWLCGACVACASQGDSPAQVHASTQNYSTTTPRWDSTVVVELIKYAGNQLNLFSNLCRCWSLHILGTYVSALLPLYKEMRFQ